MTLALRYAVRSDVGLLREGNEDSAYAGPHLLAVADGMGGHAAGEVASAATITTIAPLDVEDPGPDLVGALADAVATANLRLQELIISDPAIEGMGTTLTALLWSDGLRRALPHRRLARLPAPRRAVHPDHARPHAGPVAGRRGQDHRGRRGHPPAPLAAAARPGRPDDRRARPGAARDLPRRPLPALLRRPVRRGDRADAAPDARLDPRPRQGGAAPGRAGHQGRRPGQHHLHRGRRHRRRTAAGCATWQPVFAGAAANGAPG